MIQRATARLSHSFFTKEFKKINLILHRLRDASPRCQYSIRATIDYASPFCHLLCILCFKFGVYIQNEFQV